MTVGITTCYECWMLMARGCASKQVACLKHPPSGQPEPQVPPWAVLQPMAVWFWEAGPSPRHGTAIALPNPSVPDGLCTGTTPLCRRCCPPWQGLVQISRLQVCLLPLSPFPCSLLTHLLFKERPSVALSTTWIAYEPPSMPSPGAGGAGMHMSIRGAGTLQSKRATAKPSVPFTSDTAETSKAGENCREPSGEEGASCPTARPGALELQYVGMAAASAGRQRLRGWTAPVDAQKGKPAFIMCHL